MQDLSGLQQLGTGGLVMVVLALVSWVKRLSDRLHEVQEKRVEDAQKNATANSNLTREVTRMMTLFEKGNGRGTRSRPPDA